MRIFLSCQQALQKHDVPAYGFWETYFKRGIEEAGHEWIEAQSIDWAEGLTYAQLDDIQKWQDRTWSLTVCFIKQQHQIKPIDLFLGYLFPKQVNSGSIQEIQALGIPCVNFFCDNVREFLKVPREFQCFDLHWVPEFKALKMYQKAGLQYIHAPMPVWVPPAQRHVNHPEKYGVSFIGSRDIQREALLAEVVKAGMAVEIRGAGWIQDRSNLSNSYFPDRNLWNIATNQLKVIADQGAFAWLRKIQSKSLPEISCETFSEFVKPQPNADEYTTIIQQSIVSLGINRYPSYQYSFFSPDTYSRMRDIEAPMMGACYLTEWTEGLDRLYELGEEIETYHSSEELIDKVRILEASSEKRMTMRSKGQQRVLSDHSIVTSLGRICFHLGIKK